MKNKKNKGVIIAILVSIIIVTLSIYSYFYFNPVSYSGNLTLSIQDRQWIEKNKDKIINIAMTNNIPVYSYEGKGYIFSFIEDFKEDTNLDINGISYDYGDVIPEAEYAFKVMGYNEKIENNDILFYKDNYVVLSKTSKHLNSIKDLNGLSVGVLQDDKDVISNYLGNNIALNINGVTSIDALILDMSLDKYNYIIVPKDLYLNKTLSNNFSVSYMFDNLYKKYVLTLNKDNTKLNNIISNYYRLWLKQYDLNKSNEEEIALFTNFKTVSDAEIATFRGKRYIYGYVSNSPYDSNVNGKLVGVNRSIVNEFADYANVEFTYRKYNSTEALMEAVSNGNVDLALDYYNFNNYDKAYKTLAILNSEYVILSRKDNGYKVDTLKSLDDQKTFVLDGSKISNYISTNSTTTLKKYKDIKELNKLSKTDLLAIDYLTYFYYKNDIFSDYYVVYKDRLLEDYGYVIAKAESNSLFADLFEYHISTMNHNDIVSNGLDSLTQKNVIDLSLLWLYIILIPMLLIVILKLNSRRKNIVKIKSENKMKYIDPLTSLKNRYYLMNNLSKWNDNQIYPQSVIVVDLNRLVDVNDKYGHDKGDELIRMAANILINNQLENSDIMRINGTEFMVYLIGHSEEDIVAYIKKLSKAFKELPHEYGASIGYSMVEDEIKTIDDALSEATIAMIKDKHKNA